MEPKKYSSYAQIDRDLEILKLERDIHYRKTLLSIDKTKESIIPTNTVSFIEKVYKNVFSGTYGTILKIIIPYVINWYINRKRGD
ncbi:DUF6327 family protein [Flavobacterium aciduliphilum]|uniref:Uncharacterized protein n=1 Tax=Flavobacterium aciduliphilum TaxID=1101402 RepID=A0A328YFT0_9FLAO|nr:DUF6327 family protein [Flavobacterium aciduliphilum]RAR72878.1 hypothetical protein CLV55_104138 [Flavobacterium aciduliphilum]